MSNCFSKVKNWLLTVLKIYLLNFSFSDLNTLHVFPIWQILSILEFWTVCDLKHKGHFFAIKTEMLINWLRKLRIEQKIQLCYQHLPVVIKQMINIRLNKALTSLSQYTIKSRTVWWMTHKIQRHQDWYLSLKADW